MQNGPIAVADLTASRPRHFHRRSLGENGDQMGNVR